MPTANSAPGGEERRVSESLYQFPQKAIQPAVGDYILKRNAQGRYNVFLVEDIVLISRLVPLKRGNSVELMREQDMLDAVKPSRWREIHLLLTLFPSDYASSQTAIDSIRARTLGTGVNGVSRSIESFPADVSQVYPKRDF